MKKEYDIAAMSVYDATTRLNDAKERIFKVTNTQPLEVSKHENPDVRSLCRIAANALYNVVRLIGDFIPTGRNSIEDQKKIEKILTNLRPDEIEFLIKILRQTHTLAGKGIEGTCALMQAGVIRNTVVEGGYICAAFRHAKTYLESAIGLLED